MILRSLLGRWSGYSRLGSQVPLILTRGMVSGKKVSGPEASFRLRERLKLKASSKWQKRSHDFKALLDRKKGASEHPLEPEEPLDKSLPSTQRSLRRRRLRTLRGRKLRLEKEESISVEEFAKRVGARPTDLVEQFQEFTEGAISVTTELSPEEIEYFAEDLSIEIAHVSRDDRDIERTTVTDLDLLLKYPKRPAVVTVMGHVDHGKTTLIDRLRHTNVVAGEKGGITQSIGGFMVNVNFEGKQESICIIDTPGHEAFSQMRERGANVTDIVVLVVAADDGPLQTTEEAIRQARRAHATIIVAINKIDAENADIPAAKAKLEPLGLKVEDLGGSVQCVEISALKGTNIDALIEAMFIQTEFMDLHADRNCPGEAVCLEAKRDKHLGPVVNAIVRWGTLKVGDIVVAGTTHGKVRVLLNDKGIKIDKAFPSTPVAIGGLKDCPAAGSDILVVKDETEAKRVVRARTTRLELAKLEKTEENVALSERQLNIDDVKTTAQVILKADVQGSLDAIRFSIEGMRSKGMEVAIVGAGVGAVSEKDVRFAHTSNAVILGFNSKPDREANLLLRSYGDVIVRDYDVIYRLLEDIEKLWRVKNQPETEEVHFGTAKIQKLYDFGKKLGTILGCIVTEGELHLRNKVRVRRGEEVVFDGAITTMKHLKTDVTNISAGKECGLSIAGGFNFHEGDTIEAYEIQDLVQEEF